MKINRIILYVQVFIALAFCSCEKVTYYPDDPIVFSGTIKLAHRGGGKDSLRDNTFESCSYALGIQGGIETDVQLSKDRTIWLSHSSDIIGCSGSIGCFAETKDAVIESITTCNGVDASYTRLEEVLQFMQANNIKKYVSLDLKGWLPCSGNSLDIEAEMRVAAEEIVKLGEKYDLIDYMIIETNVVSVLNWAKKKNSSIQVYLVSYGDYEKAMLQALKNDLDGISYKTNFADELNVDMMNLLHKKGLRLMAWNIPDSAYAQYLESIKVDFLQIDL